MNPRDPRNNPETKLLPAIKTPQRRGWIIGTVTALATVVGIGLAVADTSTTTRVQPDSTPPTTMISPTIPAPVVVTRYVTVQVPQPSVTIIKKYQIVPVYPTTPQPTKPPHHTPTPAPTTPVPTVTTHTTNPPTPTPAPPTTTP